MGADKPSAEAIFTRHGLRDRDPQNFTRIFR
jgi:hypothetical protein